MNTLRCSSWAWLSNKVYAVESRLSCHVWARGEGHVVLGVCVRQLPSPCYPVKVSRAGTNSGDHQQDRFREQGSRPSLARCGGWQAGQGCRLGGTPKSLVLSLACAGMFSTTCSSRLYIKGQTTTASTRPRPAHHTRHRCLIDTSDNGTHALLTAQQSPNPGGH